MNLALIVVNALVAGGTLAVAVAAWLAARDAREIATADRNAAADREAAARTYANRRSDLDHLVAIAEALEAKERLVGPAVAAEEGKAAGVLRARVAASPVPLPALEAYVYGESATLAVLTTVWDEYRDLLPPKIRAGTVDQLRREAGPAASRAELYGKIRDLRSKLMA